MGVNSRLTDTSRAYIESKNIDSIAPWCTATLKGYQAGDAVTSGTDSVNFLQINNCQLYRTNMGAYLNSTIQFWVVENLIQNSVRKRKKQDPEN